MKICECKLRHVLIDGFVKAAELMQKASAQSYHIRKKIADGGKDAAYTLAAKAYPP